jgi:hypothetical protein
MRTAKSADAARHDSEDRRASYATGPCAWTRAPRLHVLSTKHCMRALPRSPEVITGYQRDSSSKRPSASVVFAARHQGWPMHAAGAVDGQTTVHRALEIAHNTGRFPQRSQAL